MRKKSCNILKDEDRNFFFLFFFEVWFKIQFGLLSFGFLQIKVYFLENGFNLLILNAVFVLLVIVTIIINND